MTPQAGPTGSGPRRRWLVDGMNVVGAGARGWWRDRDRAKADVAARLERFAETRGEAVTVVFDGAAPPGAGRSGWLEVVGAPRAGPDAADDEIVRRVEADDRADELVVVTSDGRLAERVRRHGAHVTGAGGFLRRLAPAGDEPGRRAPPGSGGDSEGPPGSGGDSEGPPG